MWIKAGFPLVSDRFILERIKEAKEKYQENVKRKGRMTEEECEAYSNQLDTTTFDISLPAWREQVLADSLLTEEEKRQKVDTMLDFIGPAATR